MAVSRGIASVKEPKHEDLQQGLTNSDRAD